MLGIQAYLLALRETTHFRLVYKMIKDFDNDNMRPRSYVALRSYTAIQSYAPSLAMCSMHSLQVSSEDCKGATPRNWGLQGSVPLPEMLCQCCLMKVLSTCQRLFCKARKIDATPSLGDMALFDLQFCLFEEKARKNTCLGCAWTILNTTCLHTKL